MMILSMLPAASAFAQTAPTITLTEVGHSTVAAQVSVGSSVAFTVSSTVSNAEYQFWVESPNGTWTAAGGYSSNNSYTLTPSQSGDYLVTAYALSSSQVATGDYSAATNLGSNGNQQVDGVFVNSTVSLSVPSASVVAGHSFTVSATATNIYDAQYQFWYKTPSGTWNQSGNYSSSSSFTFTPSQSGTYTFIAYAKSPLAINDPEGALYSSVQSGTVLPVVHIGLTDTASSLTNNGKSTDTFTAAVTDANGNPMPSASVTFTSSNSGVVSFASGTATTATTNGSGVATATGTAGTTVGTALVTAEADMQTSHAVTVTTLQGAATAISGASVSPTVASVTQSQSGAAAYNHTVYIGTAGKAETISAEIVDAQGNPVPGQSVVLQGNHVDQNSSVTPYRQNSVQEPSSTTFTPFSTSQFGEATSTASGMVSFTVENSANKTLDTMTASSSNTVNVTSGSYNYGLPYNTYMIDAVPASQTSSVKEGTALPSSVTANNLGSTFVGWWPTQMPGMSLGIEPNGTSMPNTYQSQDSSTTVTVNHHASFTVEPYFSNIASGTSNPDGATGNTAIPFETGSLGVLEPGQSITYNLSTNGNGVISSIFGVSLSGNGNGWSYDPATQSWNDFNSGGTNYSAANVQVTVSLQEVSGAPSYTVSVTTPNASTALTLTSPDISFIPSSFNTSAPFVPSLTFETSNALSQTNDVNASASFNNLWEGPANSASPMSGTQAVNAASASVTYTQQVQPTATSATFSPAEDLNPATSLNNKTTTETVTMLDANGNPVPNALTAFDGSIPSGYSGYFNSPTSNNALWVTKVDGTSLMNGNLPDAYPLVKAGTSLSSAGYVNPTANAGLYYANSGRLFVYSNSQGQVTLTLEGGQASYVGIPSSPTSEVSQDVGNNEFWVSAWNPATMSNLGYAQIGATGVVATTSATAAAATISPTGASGLSVTSSQNVTVQALDANGNPVSFGQITLAASGTNSNAWLTAVNGRTITSSISSNTVATPLPLFDVALASPTISLGYSSVSGSSSGVGYTGSGFTTSNPSVVVTTNSQGQANLTFQVSGFPYYSSTGTTTLNISGTSGKPAGQVSSVTPTPSGFTGFFWTY